MVVATATGSARVATGGTTHHVLVLVGAATHYVAVALLIHWMEKVADACVAAS